MGKNKSKITGGFWREQQKVNAAFGIFHQWDQLERTGCIDNFRILAENKPVFRRGWFFSDSDAYKWLEAASKILADFSDPELAQLVREFIVLIGQAQDADGYLYTYNQIHFPGTRWVNLQIEHELYCHGHLIEAGVSCFEAFGESDLLKIARKAADRIVADFMGKGPKFTPGHQEIEIALLRLFELTGEMPYLEMAKQFLALRGKRALFGVDIIKQAISNSSRERKVSELETLFDQANEGQDREKLPPENQAKRPPNIQLRWVWNVLRGQFFQQHKPLVKQFVPVGHSVRYAYLQTAAAMLDRLTGESKYLPALKKSWTYMVSRRMYLTGGIGSLPVIEGFGKDYELDPGYAYAETCAALGSLFWNREMAQLTGEAKYSDLFEWQLYNAALVGMGLGGKTYFYNNPLEAHGEITRRAWYEVPCCPSNLSRTFAGLDKEILMIKDDTVFIQHYITSAHRLELNQDALVLEMDSTLPWEGKVELKITNAPARKINLKLRIPSWATDLRISLNDETLQRIDHPRRQTLDPTQAGWMALDRQWVNGDHLTLDFNLPVQVLRAHERVRSVQGKGALACGPLIYCLENVDNPDVDIFNVVLAAETVESIFIPELLGGCSVIKASSIEGKPLTFIPYFLWGNRGKSAMTVFVGLE